MSAVGFRVIRQEFRQSDVCQWMFHQPFDGAERTGHHIGTKLGTLNHVHGAADAGRENFRAKVVVVEDVSDVLDEVHAI